MFCTNIFLALQFLVLATAQRPGNLEAEVHPKFSWNTCSGNGSCTKTDGELVLDANYRWLHNASGYSNCYSGTEWDRRVCNSEANCTETCVVEGAGDYARVFGINTTKDTVSLRFKTYLDFAFNVGSRLFVMENKTRYATFVPLNNELAFDVDLSTVECGINSALRFVAMDADGGVERFPSESNKAGAEYGTGYCDASCPRDLRFVGGKANSEGWIPSEHDPNSGEGQTGACCPEFAVWNSNSHSYSMSSHACPNNGYHVCRSWECRSWNDDTIDPSCDRVGCNYNPFRMGVKDFYGKGKKVDTSKKFTVVTRFEEARIYQFFIQDGKMIEVPRPTWEGMPDENGLSAEMCAKEPVVFGEWSRYGGNYDWKAHIRFLSRPMVLALSITDSYYDWNLWLDSIYPPYDDPPYDGSNSTAPGRARGDCPIEDSNPVAVRSMYSNAKVTWSNIRFGPIGSTVDV